MLRVTSEQFDQLCQDNPDLRLELTKDGELIVMAPAGGESSERNFDLALEVGIWNRQSGLGRAFDSSCGYDFTAIGGGKLSPDVSWIEKSRLDNVSLKGFIPVVPDFVIELRSRTDHLKVLQQKMEEYRRLGVRLGLLINPQMQQVEIYRPGQTVEVLESPTAIDCSEVMPGFILPMSRIL
jgi:Uma2 family endonuclease